MAKKKKKIVTRENRSSPLQVEAWNALNSLDLAQLPSGEKEKPLEEPAQAIALSAKAERRLPESRGRVVLRREKKDRGGKTVVVVGGFREIPGWNAVAVGELAKQLKNVLACGGSFDRQEIVLQGDRPSQVTSVLEKLGFRVEGVTSL